jgi:hypothetical protein
MGACPHGLRELLARRFPDAEVVGARLLTPDRVTTDGTAKQLGYGAPLRVTLEAGASTFDVVFRTATANDYGHDRRADRAEQMLAAFDTFGSIPGHVQAIDVGAVLPGGRLSSLEEATELYLLTTYAPGRIYAEDLRRIAGTAVATPDDLARTETLAYYLVRLHDERTGRPAQYARAIRDLVGHGEGIFGIVDGYPGGTPAASPERLAAIEQRCVGWRWRLRGRADRLARTHGDFHPFNVVFGEGTEFTLLDASRGGLGDPADDVTCMAINYLFFALDRPGAWAGGLGLLWHRFWSTYLDAAGSDVLTAAAPFFAWRALVLASPAWYPDLSVEARDRLLGLCERALEAPRFDPDWAGDLFR